MPRGSTASTGARGAIFHLGVVVVVGVLRVPHVVRSVGCKVVQRTIILNRNPAGIAVQEDRTVQPGTVYLRVKQPRRLP